MQRGYGAKGALRHSMKPELRQHVGGMPELARGTAGKPT